MRSTRKRASARKNPVRRATGGNAKSAAYDRYKFHDGRQYTGMKVGRSHKWYYDEGVWRDKKLTPDKWVISYEVTKRRAGKAPKGSGAPVGTEYHWYILAHQMVKKRDANSYSTSLNGYKFKLAHKRSATGKWNAGDKAQRNHLVKILKAYIEELESEPIEEFAEESRPAAASLKKTKSTGQRVTNGRPKPAKRRSKLEPA